MRLISLYLEAINYTSHKPQLDSLSKQLGKTPQEIIALVEPITDIARYVEWILKQLKINTIRLPEDASRIKQLLIDFDHYKSIGAANINKDIGSYKTIHDLEAVIDKLKSVDLKGRAETRQEYREGNQWIKESPNYKILKITTPEAAAHYALNTKWCTSNPETAKIYLEEGPLYIIFKKQPDGKLKKFYQYTHDYSQFMDILDISVKPDKEIQQLIKPPLNSEPEILAGFCMLTGSRWPEAEPTIAKDPERAFNYASHILKGHFPEAEPYIAKDPVYAYYYAFGILKERFLEAEPYIAKDPAMAYYYTRDVLRRPWPEAEPYIAQNPTWAYDYAKYVSEGRFPEAEPYIAQDPVIAYHYALSILRRPWPEAEPTIIKNPEYAYNYAKRVLKGRFLEAEPIIIQNPGWAYCYAIDILKRPWPEAELYIAQDLKYWNHYKLHFNIKG